MQRRRKRSWIARSLHAKRVGKKAWLHGHARWLAKTTLADLLQARESPHDETYLVKISLPSLVDCSR